ncbi:MAG TPA: glycerate kinase [Candidatus Dormibacteraeota bacterium]|nr:glycerate kinase [Candidatus Dormibacteraeota bacterium]
MRILIAPDKFKGALNAREVAENIAKGLRAALPDAKIDIVPMADGGEGTAEAICEARGGSWLKCKAHDSIGREIEARYAWIEDGKLTVMEMSEAAGMRRLSESERDPVRATTFGVGEMILDAASRGANKMIIGLGGSATNDGGSAMARALGFRFDYEHEHEHEHEQEKDRECVTDLVNLGRIEKPEDLKLPKIIAAVDVQNPLLGENGATRVFGPQKGASEDELSVLERALIRLADVVAEEFGFDYRDRPGAGAAGGLGFGLMSFCGATIRSGFDVVAEAVGLESKMKGVDVVITGEGSLDRQTLEGKTPTGVARLARKFGKKVFAIAGRYDGNEQVHELFDEVYQLARFGISEKEQMKRAGELLREKAQELAKSL